MRALLLRLRYKLWKRLAPLVDTQYVTIYGYEAMLRERADEKRRLRRIARLGIDIEDTDSHTHRVLSVLVSAGVFATPGCNSCVIYRVVDEQLGFTAGMTDSAIKRLVATGILEYVECDVPPTVHPKDTLDWWRVQPAGFKVPRN